MVRRRPLACIAVSGDRYSFGYSAPSPGACAAGKSARAGRPAGDRPHRNPGPARRARRRSGRSPPVADYEGVVLAVVEPVMNDGLVFRTFVPAAGRFLRFEAEDNRA